VLRKVPGSCPRHNSGASGGSIKQLPVIDFRDKLSRAKISSRLALCSSYVYSHPKKKFFLILLFGFLSTLSFALMISPDYSLLISKIVGGGSFSPVNGDYGMMQTGIESIGMQNMAGGGYVLVTTPNGRGGVSKLAGDYTNAHCYPNPFKPNSGLGHGKITFTRLTSHSKLRIYNIAGELVYDTETDTPIGELAWNVKNNGGENVASGVYIYVLSNDLGHQKIGKLAVVR